ncbi:hypothetical protein M011DRAFT_481384 [Sporormia fimetaria CBS 119925]|uniref:Arrestin C-terminal-like domain-containing protein n=1 Tax=Sporormia fimetaria CBS 119925 TaxID=1340428 RepID=A0A6A6UZC9_9PLEO|nr:hypothetical protein M011DRAFT_481384 [Sporormia fimetaria CBS 119925]
MDISLGAFLLPPPDVVSREGLRPLSEIQELTEPSMAEAAQGMSPSEVNTSSTIYDIPAGNVPQRSSSRGRGAAVLRSLPVQSSPRSPSLPPRGAHMSHLKARPSLPLLPAPPAANAGAAFPPTGTTLSPLPQLPPKYDLIAPRIPSRTFARDALPRDLLETPTLRHSRVTVELDLSAGTFVGGSSVEGTALITVGDAERLRQRRTLDIVRIYVDLLGIEEVPGPRRSVFINRATELVDAQNPPPPTMVYSQIPADTANPFWHLKPSSSCLPFKLSLPLDVGPPPFQSRCARIRYCLSVSLLIRDHGKRQIVRASDDITILSVYDPEKALMSLPSPLTASDEWMKPRETGVDVVRLTAGLHRQVWVSGTNLYVDVCVTNRSRKTVKKIELQLERDILCYKRVAASTLEQSASQARIFDSNERTVLSTSVTKHGTAGWHGVPAHTEHTRTCDIEVPRGHATVKCGKYFEVRFFLNVVVSSTHSKLVTVQLPIVLIHMNSLDVVPNSVAQVAAAIEERRTARACYQPLTSPRRSRRSSHSIQGLAFAAPRIQSLDRARAQAEDLEDLTQTLERSPRKLEPKRKNSLVRRPPPLSRSSSRLGLRAPRSRSTPAPQGVARKPLAPTPRRGCGSSLGFRDQENIEGSELPAIRLNGANIPKQALDQTPEYPNRFTKRKSLECWNRVANLGVGWLRGKDGRESREGRSSEGAALLP